MATFRDRFPDIAQKAKGLADAVVAALQHEEEAFNPDDWLVSFDHQQGREVRHFIGGHDLCRGDQELDRYARAHWEEANRRGVPRSSKSPLANFSRT
jgi:hypothetical protein